MKKSYVYANSQPLIRYDGSPKDPTTDIYFYLHDRLSSVRLLIDADGNVVNTYTYDPFGKDHPTEVSETIDNPFKFTGQFYDDEIGQYYLRARQYDPVLMRFTSIDPVRGKFKQPLTLHRYLYCANDPMNMSDPDGKFATFAQLLMSSAIASNLRIGHTLFMKRLEGKALDWTKSFSQLNLERGMMYDTMVNNINNDAKGTLVDAGIETLKGFSENAGRWVEIVKDVYNDREVWLDDGDEKIKDVYAFIDYTYGKFRENYLGI